MALLRPCAVSVVPSRGLTAMSAAGGVPPPICSPAGSDAAASAIQQQPSSMSISDVRKVRTACAVSHNAPTGTSHHYKTPAMTLLVLTRPAIRQAQPSSSGCMLLYNDCRALSCDLLATIAAGPTATRFLGPTVKQKCPRHPSNWQDSTAATAYCMMTATSPPLPLFPSLTPSLTPHHVVHSSNAPQYSMGASSFLPLQ